MSLRVLYPPEDIFFEKPEKSKTIFLAGSIEMGKAIDWQQKLIDKLRITTKDLNVDLYALNPRRPDWNSNWEQSINNPYFVEQVEWELTGLHNADIIVMYLAANTASPISLLELGLHVMGGKLIVFCEDGFYRKGNIDVVCKVYGITQVRSQTELLDVLIEKLGVLP